MAYTIVSMYRIIQAYIAANCNSTIFIFPARCVGVYVTARVRLHTSGGYIYIYLFIYFYILYIYIIYIYLLIGRLIGQKADYRLIGKWADKADYRLSAD